MSEPTELLTLDKMLKFLCGVEPIEGCWFGDDHPTREGRFWWRYLLHEVIESQVAPPSQAGAESSRDFFQKIVAELGFADALPNQMSNSDYWMCTCTAMEKYAAKAVEDSKKQLVSHWQPAEVEPPISYDGGNYDDAFTAGYERAIWNICTWLNPTV